MSASTTVPATACYWAVLDGAAAGGNRRAQLFAFEGRVPVPLEELQCARTRCPDGRWVVAALARETLRRHLAEAPVREPWHCGPASVPDALAEHLPATVVQELNFLHGDYEPRPRRRCRRALLALLAVGLLGAVALLAWGTRQRVAALERAAAQLDDRVAAVTGQVLGEPAEGEEALTPADRLRLALRRAGAAETRGGNREGVPRDLAPLLAQVWSRWPSDVRFQVESLTVQDDRLGLRGAVPEAADAERLARSLRGLTVDGRTWEVGEPTIDVRADRVRFLLVCEPEGTP